jgi:hypothetical protein
MIAKTATSEYLLLFRSTGWHKGLFPEEIQQNLDRFTAWFKQPRNDGKFKGGGPLVSDGKIVADRRVVIDGPFPESKEAIAGFFGQSCTSRADSRRLPRFQVRSKR